MNTPPKRLDSLDALRGFDLFFLVALGPFMATLSCVTDAEWVRRSMWLFTHVDWEGFSPWDLIMPLFMFMSGITIPFSMARHRDEADKRPVLLRLLKRVLLLWGMGMICQGNLLALDVHHIYLYSNTLQAIAAGYLFTTLLYLYTRPRTQIAVGIALLLLYAALMQFVVVDGFGGGCYEAEGNLAEWVDCRVLGRFRDGMHRVEGVYVPSPGYHYTWILSSLNFVVTVLTGLFAGYVAKGPMPEQRKLVMFFGLGAAMVALGWLWSLQMPVVKKLWTGSMVLVSSGYCFLLMGLFYYVIDYKGHKRHLTLLKVYGTNSIAAYLLSELVDFGCIGHTFLFGLEPFLTDYYPLLLKMWNIGTIYLLLHFLYRHKIFLKV